MTTKSLKTLAVSISTLCLSAALSVGCGASSEQNSESKIYGGSKTATGTWQNVVGLTVSDQGIFCTGTAISPTVVVTAAHCVEVMQDVTAIDVYIGSGQSGGAFLGQYAIKKAKANPKYFSGQGDYDVSYVVLSKALPLAADAYVPVATSKAELAELLEVGKTARVMGFGVRSNGDVGVKYQVDAPIRQLASTEVFIGGNGKDSCQGDSGGPAFGQLANGQWRQVGVVSRGGNCGEGGVYGILAANICWVQKDSGVNLGLAADACATTATASSR